MQIMCRLPSIAVPPAMASILQSCRDLGVFMVLERCLRLPTMSQRLCLTKCRSVDRNTRLGGYLPASYKSHEFMMGWPTGMEVWGWVNTAGPFNYGLGGNMTLYTGSGPLWRTAIVNWEGMGNNSALDPNPQPNPNPCLGPNSGLCT